MPNRWTAFLIGLLAGAVAALLTLRAIERGKTPVLPPGFSQKKLLYAQASTKMIF